MKTTIVMVLFAAVMPAQEKNPEPPKETTAAELQKQVTERDQKIAWLEKVVAALNQQNAALAQQANGCKAELKASGDLQVLDRTNPYKTK